MNLILMNLKMKEAKALELLWWEAARAARAARVKYKAKEDEAEKALLAWQNAANELDRCRSKEVAGE